MTRYEPAINLSAIEAIDMHADTEVDDSGHLAHPGTAGRDDRLLWPGLGLSGTAGQPLTAAR